MSPGDTCVITIGDEDSSQTYEEASQSLRNSQARARNMRPFDLIGAIVALVAGVGLLVVRSRRKKAARGPA